MSFQRTRGFTLVELVVSITIVAVAVVGVLGALTANASQGANRMIRQQATSIASAYLEEISQKSFADPGGGTGETARAAFDDVSDYNGLADVGACDQLGNAIPGLSSYRVNVTVGAGTLTGVPAADVRLIVVTVRHSSGVRVAMSGYRTRYP